MNIYVDATTLIALGTIGELDHLTAFDGSIIVPPAIQSEVTTEPAATNLERFVDTADVGTDAPGDVDVETDQAMEILGETVRNGDVALVGAVLAHRTADESVAVVSDDSRVRTVARGFGADVTGTIGVLVRAVEDGLSEADAKAIVRRVDDHGLHMTAKLYAKAEELIEDADQ